MKIQIKKILAAFRGFRLQASEGWMNGTFHLTFHMISAVQYSNGDTGNENKVALLDPGSPRSHVNGLGAPEQ